MKLIDQTIKFFVKLSNELEQDSIRVNIRDCFSFELLLLKKSGSFDVECTYIMYFNELDDGESKAIDILSDFFKQ